jgi:hypothetical protein
MLRSAAAVLASALLAAPASAQRAINAADTSAAHGDSVAAVLTPATGAYNCVRTVWAGHPGGSFRFESQGYLTLGANGTYTFAGSNLAGRYTIAPATRSVAWSGGYFADKGPLDATFGTEGSAHIEILFHERDGDTRWVCAKTVAREPVGTAGPAGPVKP